MSATSCPQAEAAVRDRNLLFLTTPRLWPAWPFLPVVRRTPQGEALGLLFDCFGLDGRTGHAATVYLANLFLLPPTEAAFLALPKEVYDTAEEIFAAGWRID